MEENNYGFYDNSVNFEHNQNLEKNVVCHRERFRRIIYARLMEGLPLLINYTNKNNFAIDFLELETNLRNNVFVVIGEMANGKIGILGYTNTYFNNNKISILSNKYVLTKKDINFTISESLILEDYKQITSYDNYESGNFVVMANKHFSQIDDTTTIFHFVQELTEIVVSRYSLIIQAKFSKVFQGEINDETINQLVSKLHNGSPFVKLGEDFNLNSQIDDITSVTQVQMLTELKREYQNKINEMLTFFGIDNIAIDKESGVSNGEVVSNNPFTAVNGNVYLKGREPIKHLCKRYNLEMTIPYFSANVQAEIREEKTNV